MARRLMITAILLLVSINGLADERQTLFDGFNLKLQRLTDAMTDKNSCALFVTSEPVYLSIMGASELTIWPKHEDLFFAFDGQHRVRVGETPAEGLKYLSKRNGLVAADAKQATRIVKALAAKTPVKIRYIVWPSHDPADVAVSAPAFAYVWGIAQKQCGWPSLGVPAELPPVEISVHTSEEAEGYVSASIAGNSDLSLIRTPSKDGSGCNFIIGLHHSIGIRNGTWNSQRSEGRLIVRDVAGKVTFDENFPPFESGFPGGAPWPKAQDAARAMWDAAPLGSVGIADTTYDKENVPLYGLRELWNWGIENCSFPKLAPASP